MPISTLLAALVLVGGQETQPPAPQTAAPAQPPAAPASPAPVVLAAGTPVKLVLLDELTSGGSKKGAVVRLALAEAVPGLPAMSPATATVCWSRTEGTLGPMSNRPARLRIALVSLKAPGGEEVPLAVDPKGGKEYEFNRRNTGRPNAQAVGSGDLAAQKAVLALIEKGKAEGLDPKQVSDLAKRLGLEETAKAAETGRLSQVEGLIQTARGGGSLASLVTGAPVAAALELVNLAGDIGRGVGKRLGGRNIRAYPGTVVLAYVAKETTVKPPPAAP